MNNRITFLTLLLVTLGAHHGAAQSALSAAPDPSAGTSHGPRREAAVAPRPIIPPSLSIGADKIRPAAARASTGRQALHGALIGAAAGLVTGLLLDEGGYSAGGEENEEGGSTVWVMVPLGAAAGALLAVVL